MIGKNDKRYVSCPVCGRVLMKCKGVCDIDIVCGKCGREITAFIDEEKVIIWENRKAGQVCVSVVKGKNGMVLQGE